MIQEPDTQTLNRQTYGRVCRKCGGFMRTNAADSVAIHRVCESCRHTHTIVKMEFVPAKIPSIGGQK